MKVKTHFRFSLESIEAMLSLLDVGGLRGTLISQKFPTVVCAPFYID